MRKLFLYCRSLQYITCKILIIAIKDRLSNPNSNRFYEDHKILKKLELKLFDGYN